MEELIRRLRRCYSADDLCAECEYEWEPDCLHRLIGEAADAIEELQEAAKSMHTWIFLNSADEQAAYDECGLTDEMNAALGYGGQIVVEPPKDKLKWIDRSSGWNINLECPVCGTIVHEAGCYYCPNCGADMREES